VTIQTKAIREAMLNNVSFLFVCFSVSCKTSFVTCSETPLAVKEFKPFSFPAKKKFCCGSLRLNSHPHDNLGFLQRQTSQTKTRNVA